MEIKDQFEIIDENELMERNATWYMTEQDMEDLIVALDLAMKNPKAAFSKRSQRFPKLLRQFKQVLK